MSKTIYQNNIIDKYFEKVKNTIPQMRLIEQLDFHICQKVHKWRINDKK